MNEKRFNIRKSHVIKNGWFIEDSLKKFTFPTSKGDKGCIRLFTSAERVYSGFASRHSRPKKRQ